MAIWRWIVCLFRPAYKDEARCAQEFVKAFEQAQRQPDHVVNRPLGRGHTLSVVVPKIPLQRRSHP